VIRRPISPGGTRPALAQPPSAGPVFFHWYPSAVSIRRRVGRPARLVALTPCAARSGGRPLFFCSEVM
jgi:hypothetical protein